MFVYFYFSKYKVTMFDYGFSNISNSNTSNVCSCA